MSPSKVVLVTGVSSGIGRTVAKKLAEQNCLVFGTVRNLSKSQAIPGVVLIEMDVRDEASITRGIETIISQAKRIDVLVNSAGVTLLGAAEETSMAEAQSLFDTNFFGLLRTIKAVLPHMRHQRSGRIVNVSSVLGFLPAPYMALYSASKHAIEGLSESLDHEVRQFGIRVSLIEPSFTKTNLDLNAPQTVERISDYSKELSIVSKAIQNNVQKAPMPNQVADTIVKASLGAWKMRHTPKGEASLLAKLRRFMPAAPVEKGLRKTFGLA
ncbi:oxidoreductase [Methylotenera mobilis]|uniref:Short-chain dehydrogenase/reductase SDR n=1 Tax=Methylotenera mobilis (strain JLW8 / ATCC BAA-1282 / DSM 17540) TaxID=583345 RepID=C6WYM5_METML|nr:oxidoreductase [Methylotenera mobilis]ACT47000.1 short-chain dehydrogenase/reductase SDR [Methylotenera mobilis JLW8]